MGSGGSPTYGQTFTATASESILNSILFKIDNFSGSPIPYHASVYQWTGTTITGSALFTSGLSSVPAAGLQAVTVNTGAVSLTPGTQYVAFFSTIGDGGSTNAAWGLITTDVYAGGNFVLSNATTSAGLTGPWSNFSSFDGAFTFSFGQAAAAVPEPATLTAACLGLATLAGYGYRRWRSDGQMVIRRECRLTAFDHLTAVVRRPPSHSWLANDIGPW